MYSKDEFKAIIDAIDANSETIEFNEKIFNISEGDLSHYVKEELQSQLSGKPAKLAAQRMAPINVWNKIISKLSTPYTRPVVRKTENEGDQELINDYVSKGINESFQDTNENYNSYKWTCLEIYQDENEKDLKFRSMPANKFWVFSNDKSNPLKMTMLVKFMGKEKDEFGSERRVFFIYTDDEFYIIYDNGDIALKRLEEYGIEDFRNPYGVIPMEYITMSKYLLVPKPDNDTLQMTILIPVLLTDMNFGSMYLSHPMVYTIDAAEGDLPASPNLVFDVKSEGVDHQASIGVVKAEPNLEAQMNHVIHLLSAWLDSRDIRPGTVGKVNADNFANGISKLIAESDTVDNRKKQEIKFSKFENNFWRRLAKIHNILAENGGISDKRKFSNPETLTVVVEYSEEKIIETREDKIRRLKNERDAGFRSTRSAIVELNPKLSDKEIDELVEEIGEEGSFTIMENFDNGNSEENSKKDNA